MAQNTATPQVPGMVHPHPPTGGWTGVPGTGVPGAPIPMPRPGGWDTLPGGPRPLTGPLGADMGFSRDPAMFERFRTGLGLGLGLNPAQRRRFTEAAQAGQGAQYAGEHLGKRIEARVRPGSERERRLQEFVATGKSQKPVPTRR
jgi:hypothetical protein